MTSEMPALPTMFSPQVFFSRPTLRSIASTGPMPSAARTGTTRKVVTVQASPAPASISRPMRPSRSPMKRSSRPTVAETMA